MLFATAAPAKRSNLELIVTPSFGGRLKQYLGFAAGTGIHSFELLWHLGYFFTEIFDKGASIHVKKYEDMRADIFFSSRQIPLVFD
jgi:hypothetical protein